MFVCVHIYMYPLESLRFIITTQKRVVFAIYKKQCFNQIEF